MNLSEIADADNFRSLLSLYAFTESREREKVTINIKRIEGISEISMVPVDRLFKGTMIRGQKVILTVNLDQYSGWGDLYLFGSVIDLFLSSISSMNTFIELEIHEKLSGEILKWSPRIGNRPLI